jgi:hypothetical protein
VSDARSSMHVADLAHRVRAVYTAQQLRPPTIRSR